MYKQSKPMLNASEQINYLKNKGVKFELISESDAENYLKINNNYFKLTSYRKTFLNMKMGKILENIWTAPQMLDKKCLIFGGAFFMGRYPDEVKLAVIKYCVDESHSIN